MSLIDRLRVRLELLRIQVGVAYKAVAKAEKEAAKDKLPVPRHLMDRLVETVSAAKLECYSVEASLCGVSKYPPLKVNQ